jgi:AcrR family transcriptional regulator
MFSSLRHVTRRGAETDILEAAEELFAKTRYADVSLRQLIAASGVSTTAFYARFDSKAAVLDTLAQQLFADLHKSAIVTLREARDFTDGVDRAIALLVARFAPRKALVRLILAESGSLAVRRQAYAILVALLTSRLHTLASRGRIAVTEPDALAWAIVGALEIQITRWAVWNDLPTESLHAALLAAARAILPEEL